MGKKQDKERIRKKEGQGKKENKSNRQRVKRQSWTRTKREGERKVCKERKIQAETLRKRQKKMRKG